MRLPAAACLFTVLGLLAGPAAALRFGFRRPQYPAQPPAEKLRATRAEPAERPKPPESSSSGRAEAAGGAQDAIRSAQQAVADALQRLLGDEEPAPIAASESGLAGLLEELEASTLGALGNVSASVDWGRDLGLEWPDWDWSNATSEQLPDRIRDFAQNTTAIAQVVQRALARGYELIAEDGDVPPAETRNKRIPFLRRRADPAEARGDGGADRGGSGSAQQQRLVPSMEPNRNSVLESTADFLTSSETIVWLAGAVTAGTFSAIFASFTPLLLWSGAETVFAVSCVAIARFVLETPAQPDRLGPGAKVGRLSNDTTFFDLNRELSAADREGLAEGMAAVFGRLDGRYRQRAWREAWELALAESPDVKAFLSGWFYDADFSRIRLEDAQEFLAWGVFGRERSLLSAQEARDVDDAVRGVERAVGGAFLPRAEGEGPLPCIRFSIEPLRWRHKPLSFYLATQGVINSLMRSGLRRAGFRRRLMRAAGADAGINYWIKEGEGTPIVFMHGIGGLPAYADFVKALASRTSAPVIAVEQPHVSMHISPSVVCAADMVLNLAGVLREHALPPAVFVGHSFGSLTLSWMSQALPDLVAGNVFLDPITFQLNLPSVCVNFHYRKKERKNPLSVAAFSELLSTELFAAHACLRGFWWSSSALWAQDIQRLRLPTRVVVSADDAIVPSAAVQAHIDRHERRFGARSFVSALSIEDCGHGEWLFDEEKGAVVLEEIGSVWARADAKRAEAEAVSSVYGFGIESLRPVEELDLKAFSARIMGRLEELLYSDVRADGDKAANVDAAGDGGRASVQ